MTTVFTNSRGQQVLSITQDGGNLTLSAGDLDDAFIRSVEIVGDFSLIGNPVKGGDFATPTISLDGKTLTFEFATSNSGGGNKRFNDGDSFAFDFTGTGLTSATTHVQGFPWGSEKITASPIPEPGSILLGSIGLLLLLLRRR